MRSAAEWRKDSVSRRNRVTSSADAADPKNDEKKGRPAGAKNIPTAPVLELPPACPRCGSIGPHDFVRNVKTLYHTGVIGDGIRFNRVKIRIRKCKCGQHLSVRTYEWHDDGTKEA